MKKPKRLFKNRPQNRAIDGPIVLTDRSKAVVSPALDLPEVDRNRIAAIVHGMVDGLGNFKGGRCAYYALAGFAILEIAKHIHCSIQCGSLTIQPNPEGPTLHFGIDAESPGAKDRGEFHAWIATPEGVMIDFSARDWPQMVGGSKMGRMSAEQARLIGGAAAEDTVDEPMKYQQVEIPYLWSAWNEMPEFVHLRANFEVTGWLQRELLGWDGMKEFMKQAVKTYLG